MNLKSVKSYPVEEFVERAEFFYQSKMNEWLKSNLKGKFAAIDPDAGEYFIGETVVEAMRKAYNVHRDKIYHIVKIGYRTSAALK